MIDIEYKAPFFKLSFSFNREDLAAVRDLPVRVWDKVDKVWNVPRLSVKSLASLANANWSTEALAAKTKIEKSLLDLVSMKFEEGESKGILRPYQVVGANFLVTAKKALLADDMGLGKTIQAIQALIDLDVKKALIVVPASLKWKWYDEFYRHFKLTPIVIDGSKPERVAQWKSKSKFIICNYELLLGAHDWDIMPHDWDAVVADEAVYLKNPKAERTKRMKKLKSEVRIALSGMYIERNLLEFQSIMDWVRPEVITPAYRFKYRYCKIDYMGNVIGANPDKLPELHMLTSPFVLRRMKIDKLPGLPPKIYTDIPLEMTSEERSEYARLSDVFKQYLKDISSGENRGKELSAWDGTLNCREFVEFPTMVKPGWTSKPSKLKWLEEVYDEVDKIVVFSFFKRSIEYLQKHFDTPFIISGDIEASTRFEMAKKFNSAKKAILVSTDAGRFGLDFVGADTIVHYGYVHNPGTMVQREDRLWRMGQEKRVNVLRPYLRYTIDEGILKVYQQRLKFSEDFVEGSDKMGKLKLSTENYAKLIEGKDV